MKKIALALGAGGARGLAHIPVLEALDELGIEPAVIAGASAGALIGSVYASGMAGKDIRRHVLSLMHNRGDVFSRLLAARSGGLVDLVTSAISGPGAVNAEKFCDQFLPAIVPDDFAKLLVPLTVVASDLHRRDAVVLSSGPLRPAIGASMALPGLIAPVVIDDRVLIDGGATNPLPFDLWRRDDYLTIAIDVAGEPITDRADVPSAWETLNIAVQVMVHTITVEKLRHGEPDLLIRPKVGVFRSLDFLQASAILRASEPIKAEVKEKLLPLLAA
jgi:NTE family protein